MPSIRTIQSRDVQFLVDTFPDHDETYFNTCYIDHLQDKSYMLVVCDDDDNSDELIYSGYASIRWQSERTPFWRRNIPEIINLVADDSRSQQLLQQMEQAAAQRGQSEVGVYLTEDALIRLYTNAGYTEQTYYSTLSQDKGSYLTKKRVR